MIDRLISGAGAVAATADRMMRIALHGGADGPGRRPLSLGLALLLGIVSAAGAGLAGEAGDQGAPRALELADVGTLEWIGPRAYATIIAAPDLEYLVTFTDLDGDGTQGESEPDESWIYFLVDRTSATGLAVRSDRPPPSMFRVEAHGTLVRDPGRIAADLGDLALDPTVSVLDLDVHDALYLDTRSPPDPAATLQPLDLGAMPRPGDAVSLTASMVGMSLEVCEGDGAGWCAGEEVDAYDTIVFDPASRRAIVVVTDDVPQPLPVAITGMLRRDPVGARDAVTAEGFDIASLGVTVSPEYILDDGQAPASAMLAGIVALLAVAGAGMILVGVAGGYVVFRASRRTAPSDGEPLPAEEGIPVRISGVVRRPDGLLHVREAPGRLTRFRYGVDADGVEDTTLLVERTDRPEGVPLGYGHVDGIQLGRAMLFRGTRPAIRVATETGPVVLSFASIQDRDRAAYELAREIGI